MRVVFMGTPALAAAILSELANQHDVVGAFTQPDKVRGRGKKLVPTPVREEADRLGIPVFTPATLKDADVQAQLASLRPDVICVAAYGMILPEAVLELPPLGCVNVHASLLPRWRGAAPIERAILAGDEFAGVCIMRMERGLDTGDWCVRREIPVDGMNATQLQSELADLGAAALLVALQQMEQGHVVWTAQDDAAATYAAKVEKGELDADPACDVESNVRRVRASLPAHPSRARLAGRDVILEEAVPCEGRPVPEGLASAAAGRLLLGCSDGAMEVTRLKPSGKGSMDARAFLQGFRPPDGELRWERP